MAIGERVTAILNKRRRFLLVQQRGPISFVLREVPVAGAPSETGVSASASSIGAEREGIIRNDDPVAVGGTAAVRGASTCVEAPGASDDEIDLGDESGRRNRRRGEVVRVSLGKIHKCTCEAHSMIGKHGVRKKSEALEPCVHILFILLKVFRVPERDWRLHCVGLGDREIGRLLEERESLVAAALEAARKKAAEASIGNIGTGAGGREHDTGSAPERVIDASDACPICMDNVVADSSGPVRPSDLVDVVTCSVSCGSSLHRSCALEWIHHQFKVGSDVKCPLCRAEWDEDLQESFTVQGNGKGQHRRSSSSHGGVGSYRLSKSSSSAGAGDRPTFPQRCSGCGRAPIATALFRCVECVRYYLCSHCFCKGIHSSHSFRCRDTPAIGWRRVKRLATLPTTVRDSLGTRELTDADYTLLSTLDHVGVFMYSLPIPEKLVNITLPIVTHAKYLRKCRRQRRGDEGHYDDTSALDVSVTSDTGSAHNSEVHTRDARAMCGICREAFKPSDRIRVLKCACVFHTTCIDPWFLEGRNICPLDREVCWTDEEEKAHVWNALVIQKKMASAKAQQERDARKGGTKNELRTTVAAAVEASSAMAIAAFGVGAGAVSVTGASEATVTSHAIRDEIVAMLQADASESPPPPPPPVLGPLCVRASRRLLCTPAEHESLGSDEFGSTGGVNHRQSLRKGQLARGRAGLVRRTGSVSIDRTHQRVDLVTLSTGSLPMEHPSASPAESSTRAATGRQRAKGKVRKGMTHTLSRMQAPQVSGSSSGMLQQVHGVGQGRFDSSEGVSTDSDTASGDLATLEVSPTRGRSISATPRAAPSAARGHVRSLREQGPVTRTLSSASPASRRGKHASTSATRPAHLSNRLPSASPYEESEELERVKPPSPAMSELVQKLPSHVADLALAGQHVRDELVARATAAQAAVTAGAAALVTSRAVADAHQRARCTSISGLSDNRAVLRRTSQAGRGRRASCMPRFSDGAHQDDVGAVGDLVVGNQQGRVRSKEKRDTGPVILPPTTSTDNVAVKKHRGLAKRRPGFRPAAAPPAQFTLTGTSV